MTLETLYKQIALKSEESAIARLVLEAENWFAALFDFETCFDPVTDKPLASSMDKILPKALFATNKNDAISYFSDRLEKIVKYTEKSVYALFDELHDKNIRFHYVTHAGNARELDSKSLRWLSKKPGRTVRQKIATDQKLLAVRHDFSIDTAENRLLKAFIKRLDDLLFEKENALSIDAPDFNIKIHRWLVSEDADEIGRWTNLPPNNTLLNDKNYRKIWKAWCKLQAIDDDISRDYENIQNICAQIAFWTILAILKTCDNVRFLQQPLFGDYENLSINTVEANELKISGFMKNKNTWNKFSVAISDSKIIINKNDNEKKADVTGIKKFSAIFDFAKKISQENFVNISTVRFDAENFKPRGNISNIHENYNDLAAVDFANIMPYSRCKDKQLTKLPIKLIHQIWETKSEDNKFVDVFCAESKYIATANQKIQTLTIHNIFDENDFDKSRIKNNELFAIEHASETFVKSVAEKLNTDICCYVVPDNVDDFSPAQITFRRAMNSAFTKTVPVPRSIAAVFSALKNKKKFQDKQIIYVIDKSDNFWCVTKIETNYDKKLVEQNPKTNGIIFERHPSEIIFNVDDRKKKVYPHGFPEKLQNILSKTDALELAENFTSDDFHFEKSEAQKIEVFDFQKEFDKKFPKAENPIELTRDMDVTDGVLYLYELQQITPEKALWRDYLPPLSLKYFDEHNAEKTFQLVGKNTKVEPQKNMPVRIEIKNKFLLPAKKYFYQFPLLQGDNSRKQKYFAYINHNSFPLGRDVTCDLILTYTYGDEMPYKLVFVPLDEDGETEKPFESVTVNWETKDRKDHLHLPYPNFCQEYTWEDMTQFPKRDEEGTSNLIGEWLPGEFTKLANYKILRVKKLLPRSSTQESDAVFLDFVCQNRKKTICYIPTSENIQEGDYIACYLEQTNRGWQGKAPFVLKNDNSNKFTSFRKSLRFPALTVWNNGRSLQDADCPNDFRLKTFNAIQNALKIAANKDMPQSIKDEMFLLLSYIHKDAPNVFRNILPKMFDKNIEQYHKNIGYAIGDGKLEWQKDLLTKTIALFAEENGQYAFAILAICLWRVKSLVFELEYDNVDIIIKKATEKIKNSLTCTKDKYNYKKKNEIGMTEFGKQIVSVVEVVLAILRLRETQNEKMLKLLSPEYNEDLQGLCEQLKKLSEKLKKDEIVFNSRINFDIQQHKNDATPPLLFATTKYATGEIESNSIRVLSVTEEE